MRDHLAQSLSLRLKKPVLREVQETVRAAGTQPGPMPRACFSASPGLGLPRHQSQGQTGPDSGTRNPCEDTAGPGAACPQLKLLHSGRDPAPHLLCARSWGHRPERHRAARWVSCWGHRCSGRPHYAWLQNWGKNSEQTLRFPSPQAATGQRRRNSSDEDREQNSDMSFSVQSRTIP